MHPSERDLKTWVCHKYSKMGKSEIAMHEAKEKPFHVAETSKVDEQLCGNVVISIKNMLELQPPANLECSIYRVPKLLRQMNETALYPSSHFHRPFSPLYSRGTV